MYKHLYFLEQLFVYFYTIIDMDCQANMPAAFYASGYPEQTLPAAGQTQTLGIQASLLGLHPESVGGRPLREPETNHADPVHQSRGQVLPLPYPAPLRRLDVGSGRRSHRLDPAHSGK